MMNLPSDDPVQCTPIIIGSETEFERSVHHQLSKGCKFGRRLLHQAITTDETIIHIFMQYIPIYSKIYFSTTLMQEATIHMQTRE